MTTTNMFLNFGGKWDSPPLAFAFYMGEHTVNTYIYRNTRHAQQYQVFHSPAKISFALQLVYAAVPN